VFLLIDERNHLQQKYKKNYTPRIGMILSPKCSIFASDNVTMRLTGLFGEYNHA
jgi:hypothetical protein